MKARTKVQRKPPKERDRKAVESDLLVEETKPETDEALRQLQAGEKGLDTELLVKANG